jgi:hypothetical protein
MVLTVGHVNRLRVSRQDYSIYVHTISTVSSEKHLDRDTRELSEFEVLLTYVRSTTAISEPRSPTPDRLAGHCPGVLSTITKRLKELADQESAYRLECIRTISRRQIYDAVVAQRRTEEDEKYGAILAARGPEQEQKRQMRTAEDTVLRL